MMTPEQKAAFVSSQTAIMNCRVESMKATNALAQFHGGEPPYTLVHFLALEKEFEPVIGYNAVLTLFNFT